MRYRYCGLKRDSGELVRGHVEAESEAQAFDVLGDHGVVVESLQIDPEPIDDSLTQPDIANAIDHALDASSRQVRFDKLTRRYRGKRVWVIDREKIKRRVMKAVDNAVRQSQKEADGDAATRDRIAEALESVLGDNQNLTSPFSAKQESLEEQIQRLTRVVHELESTFGSIRVASRRSTWSDGPRRPQSRQADNPHDAVLMDIFRYNVDLRRRLSGEAPSPPDNTPADPPAQKTTEKAAKKTAQTTTRTSPAGKRARKKRND